MKKAKLLVVGMVAVSLILTSGCSLLKKGDGSDTRKASTEDVQTKKTKRADKIDYGQVNSQVYENKYFGLKVSIPEGWNVQDQKTTKEMMEKGKDLAAGKDKNFRAVLDASEQNTLPLLTMSQYPQGTAVESNPSFMAIAEKTSQFPGIKTGKDYLFNVKKGLDQSQVKYSFDKAIYTEKVGGVDFDVLEGIIKVGSRKITQRYYASVMRGYSLSFITTSTSEDGDKLLEGVISKVNIEE